MFSPELLDHFQNPRNVGTLDPPALTVEVSNPACGDLLQLSARIEQGRIAQIRFRTRGCTASIAAGSALTELLQDKSVEEARGLQPGDVEAALGGLSNESKHAAQLAIDGVRALLGKFRQSAK
jgi:NifU-like protein involved in Fe-S cluster formation